MLDFLDFLTNRFSLKAEMDGYFRRVANLNAEDCRYLLIMHNHKKIFLLESEIYEVYKRLQWLPKNELTVDIIAKELSEIALAKEPYGNRKIGF